MITVTSQSAVTTAMLIAENKLSGVGGVFTPETALPKDDYINRMREHGVNIEITECEV